MHIFYIFFVLLSSIYFVSSEVFSATEDIEKLLETHTAIVNELPNYIERDKLRIAYLESQLKVFQKEDKEAKNDVYSYLQNPLNAFKFIKRLTRDLHCQGEYLDTESEYIKYLKVSHPHLTFPSHEDLIGAAQALARLQVMYKLNVTELAEGKLKDAYSSPMSSEDCFVVGRIIYEEPDNKQKHALPWFKEALRKFKQGDRGSTLTELEILKYIAHSYNRTGDLESAIEWSIKMIALEPDHRGAHDDIHYYFNRFLELNKKLKLKADIEDALTPLAITTTNELPSDRYESLCRGDLQLDHQITKRLFCWYSRKQHPFLKLAPIKVEQVYMQPDVFVFHHVISDHEIQQIKDLARPRFSRALVSNLGGSPLPAPYRISKSGWLKDWESPVLARITQRIADMTGLAMDTAEDLQVANYGIGGHYSPHLDYSPNPKEAYSDGTNRIATVLFYMSEVAQGGATVFTELGLSVFPIKNAALFWLNLHPSGEGDRATKHAACPVLRGSKWASNKWIHLRGQEFIKPCNLEFQPETLVKSFPAPLLKNLR